MWFWIYMFVMELITPLIMICFGRYFMKKAPKEINDLFGYRTSMSMKNMDTWEFAHKYCGKIWHIAGWIILPFTVISMLLVLGGDEDTVGTVGGVVLAVQVIILLVSITLTERALRRTFDKNGRRKV